MPAWVTRELFDDGEPIPTLNLIEMMSGCILSTVFLYVAVFLVWCVVFTTGSNFIIHWLPLVITIGVCAGALLAYSEGWYNDLDTGDLR